VQLTYLDKQLMLTGTLKPQRRGSKEEKATRKDEKNGIPNWEISRSMTT